MLTAREDLHVRRDKMCSNEKMYSRYMYMDTSSFSVIIMKNNFSDCLSVSLDNETLQERDLLLKGKNLLLEEQILLF